METKEVEFDEAQNAAISACCDDSRRIVAVTGCAGTGKTTILKRVHDTFKARKRSVVLCAPTGKAAKRIQEATGIPACTFHRLLEYPHPGERDEKTGKALVSTEPKRDRQNPINYDVVLADEYAMANTEIHRNLLDALPNGGIIRVFGDANQLSPIEKSDRQKQLPSPFEDLLERFDGHVLNTIHRQAGDSTIIEAGERITKGIMPRRTEDFTIKITDEPVRAVEDLIMDGLDDGYDYGALDCQIITVTNKGWVGTQALNQTVQSILQPMSKPYIDIARHTWAESDTLRVYEGDKIIYTVNNYPLEIFNGETGLVTGFDEAGQLIVDFGDRVVPIPPMLEMEGKHGTFTMDPQKDLDLAYVITTHKAQGSEYDRVAYVLNKSRSFNMNRKNFYTAISRARKHVTLITDQKSLQLSLVRKDERSIGKKRR